MNSPLPERFIVENQIYFDTSSLNELINNSVEDCIATQHLWAKKERRMCLSAVNLYEIFRTSDVKRRDEIIYKMGILFYGNSGYIDMPTRILFGETIGYFTDELTSLEKSLRDSWFNVKRDPKNITFNFDYVDFGKRRDILKSLAKALKFVLREEFYQMDEDDIFELRNTINPIVYISSMAIKKIFINFPDLENKRINHVKLILIYFIFCFGIEPQSDFLDEYWNSKEDGRNKIEGVLDRAIYILSSNDELLNSGILTLMAEFIIFESTNKGIGRGTLSDSLHLIYSYYCFNFITDDQSILDFAMTKPLLKSRVLSVKNDFYFANEG